MTAKEWVRSTLANLIQPDDSIRFTDSDNNSQDTAIADFLNFFGPAIDGALTGGSSVYDSLSGSHTFTLDGEVLTMTAAEMGYAPFFDQWHADRLI